MLNEYFKSVFTVEDTQNMPKLETHKTAFQGSIDISRDSVEKKLKYLKEDKSPGPDMVHPYILKNLAESLSFPLTLLFQQSIKEKKIPDDWREANITAIFKKGDRKQPGNYRPVSLTSVVCKLLEELVKKAIVDHMQINHLISNKQHGFLQGKSCVTNLLETLDCWTTSLEAKRPVDALYLDYRKAFDKVPHKRLIQKLHMYNIHPGIVSWVEDFLRARQQRVCVNGHLSDWRPVTSGIPQGSVLGPVLFIVFINDLPSCINTDCRIFADDTKVYTEVSKSHNNTLQDDICSLQDWSEKWQMEFNVDKCAVLQLGANNPHHNYIMEVNHKETILKQSEEERDLGILVDHQLNFKKHIEFITQKANRTLGVIKRHFKYLPEKYFVTLYKTMVRSKLEYGNVIWSPIFEADRDKIERIQRRATRCLKRIKHLNYAERLRKLKLPTLDFRRKRGDLIQAHKILHNRDKVVDDLLILSTNTNTRGHSLKLEKHYCQTHLRKHFFSNRIVDAWNSLPEEAVLDPDINGIKIAVDSAAADTKYCYKDWTQHKSLGRPPLDTRRDGRQGPHNGP